MQTLDSQKSEKFRNKKLARIGVESTLCEGESSNLKSSQVYTIRGNAKANRMVGINSELKCNYSENGYGKCNEAKMLKINILAFVVD